MLTATIDQLRTVATAADDASGYFPAMYSRVTSRVEQASARMEPSQAASMERFARTFAAWYLEPISGRRPMPGCWQAAADVAGDADLLIAQQLLLALVHQNPEPHRQKNNQRDRKYQYRRFYTVKDEVSPDQIQYVFQFPPPPGSVSRGEIESVSPS